MPRDPLSPAMLRAAAAQRAEVSPPAGAPGLTARLSFAARAILWWRALLRRREERLYASALGALSQHLVRDINVDDALRLRALALHESQIDRLARTSAEWRSLTGRFGF